MWKNLVVAAIVMFASMGQARGQDASVSDEILLGMSTALTGPAARLGLNMKTGVESALNEANIDGGIQGRQLQLLALDDGYEPSRTAPNMHELIDTHRVLAVVGNVGTPTAVTAIPIANANKTVLFGAFTGAGVLRKAPPDRYVINFRASYAEETAAMVDGLVQEVGIAVDEIAFFTQRDAYGDAGYVGGIAAMKRHGLENDDDVAHGRYERNTVSVENGLADIINAKTPVRAVIMVGAYEPCAAFIQLAKEFELNCLFLNVSFVGSEPLAETLGKAGDDVVIMQVVPHYESNLPVAKRYLNALHLVDENAEPNFGSFEGYIVGRILTRALRDISGEITREDIVDSLESLGHFDIGHGASLELSGTAHQACHQVWPTVIRNHEIVPLDWADLELP